MLVRDGGGFTVKFDIQNWPEEQNIYFEQIICSIATSDKSAGSSIAENLHKVTSL